jgi:hypothetical protein
MPTWIFSPADRPSMPRPAVVQQGDRGTDNVAHPHRMMGVVGSGGISNHVVGPQVSSRLGAILRSTSGDHMAKLKIEIGEVDSGGVPLTGWI